MNSRVKTGAIRTVNRPLQVIAGGGARVDVRTPEPLDARAKESAA